MKVTFSILLAFSIIIANILIGHYYPPYGIDFSPIAALLATLLIVVTASQLFLYYQSLIVALLVIAQDVGIRLFSGGSSDWEGMGWIISFFFISSLISICVIIAAVIKNKKSNLKEKLISLLILPVSIALYLVFFWKLGLE